jgi:hypothetical protein
MARKAMKGFVSMMMIMVLAIFVQAVVQADNPSFSYISPNHPPSLPPFSHFPPIISLSPYHDSKPHGENKMPGSELTYSERKCLDKCRKKIKYSRLLDPFLKMGYIYCIRICLRYELP